MRVFSHVESGQSGLRQELISYICRDQIVSSKKRKSWNNFLLFQARRDIAWDTQNKTVFCMECDLASQESIRNFVQDFCSSEYGSPLFLLHQESL